MLQGKEFKDEERYLEKTLETVKSLLSKYVDLSELQDKEIVKHRKFLWDNRSEFDEIEVNENCAQVAIQEKIYAKKVNRIKTLERQLLSPYFARIDFKEKGEEAESFYIGLATVEKEEDYDFLVFDWRSPVATMFYDFEVGEAFYNAPGRKVEGTIEFSRQFNIKNGKIVFMHNSNESLCDEALVSILGGNATDKMKNIVATIQKEQNEIIRNEDSKILFIQGAAGSGKTSIALHRAAYLLYKHRKTLKADNILIFSPNEVFADYIGDVLPELGESNVMQTTFESYSKSFLPKNYIYESKEEHLDYIYTEENKRELGIRKSSMEFKNSIDFMEILKNFTMELWKEITNFTSIIIDGKEVIKKNSVEKTFLQRFKEVPFLNRISMVKESLFSQVENKYLSSKDDFEYVEDKNIFFDYCREQISIQVDNMIKTLNVVEIYKLLWSNIEKYSKEDLADIGKLTIESINSGIVRYEDIVPIIYIRASMEGFRNYNEVKHILIDECQDYSPLFYEIIKKSFKGAAMTIMGDLNQRIDNYSNVKNREEILNIFDNAKVAVLAKSYRSTWNITNFTKKLLKNPEPIEAVERRGEEPKVHNNVENLGKELALAIRNMEEKDFKSIAVIAKNKRECKRIYNILKEEKLSVNLLDSDTGEYKEGVNIIPSYLSKGLEFDGVIVADGANYNMEDESNLLYTICTRALHELEIFNI